MKDQKGSTLIVTVMFIAVLIILGVALLSYTHTEKLIAANQADQVLLFYIAEAGVEAGLAAVLQDFQYQHTITEAIAGLEERQARYVVAFLPHPEGKLVSSTGYLDEETTLTLRVLVSPSVPEDNTVLTVKNLFASRAAIYGGLHVNNRLRVEDSLMVLGYREEEGKFSFCSLRPDDITINGFLYVASDDRFFTGADELPAEMISPTPQYLPYVLIDAVERQFNPVIIGEANPLISSVNDFPGYQAPPGGADPGDYYGRNAYIFENGLTVNAWNPLEFTGVIIVKGQELVIDPGSIININGIIVSEKKVRLKGQINYGRDGNVLAVLAHGGIEVENNHFLIDRLFLGGYTFLYSHGPIYLGSVSPHNRLTFKGAAVTRDLTICDTDYYCELSPFAGLFDYLPGIRVAVVKWERME